VIRRRQRDDRGAAAVEFALVMPILLMLVFAIISFGWLFAQKQAVGNAARQTARYGVVEARTCHTTTDAAGVTNVGVIEEAADAAAPLADMTTGNSAVTVQRGTATSKTTVCTGADDEQPCKGSAPGDNIYVTINYEADVLIPVIPGMGNEQPLSGEGVFRCEFF
jgi:Flp pilus assembly protein TadG